MGRIGELEFKKQINDGNYSNAYLVYGEEGYLKEQYIQKLKNKIVDKTFESFNFHSFESKDSTIAEIIQSAEIMPMMSEYSFVLVHDYPIDKSSSDCDMLKEYLKDLPENSVIVFWYDSIDFDVKKNAKFKSIENVFQKFGMSVNMQKRSESDLAKLLIAGAKKRNVILSQNDARYMISVVGSDMKTLINELEKLCGYVKDGEITKKIIDNMATKCLAAKIYDISKAIVKGNFETAYSVLDTLMSQKEEPIVILSVISSAYVDMYRCKCAKIANVGEKIIAENFNYRGREFAIRNAMRDCSSLNINQLRSSLDVIGDADTKLKSTGVDKKIILEETLLKLLIISKEN